MEHCREDDNLNESINYHVMLNTGYNEVVLCTSTVCTVNISESNFAISGLFFL